MEPSKSERLIFIFRFSIYMVGFFVVLFFVFVNTLQEKNEISNFSGETIPYDLQFIVPSTTNYKKIKVIIELRNLVTTNEFVAKTTKTLSPLIRKRNLMITTKEKTNEVFENDNSVQYKNGNFVEYRNHYYFIERGIAREITDSKTFDILGIKKQEIQKTDNAILKMKQGDEITTATLQNNFPRGMIIDAEGNFFVVGANKIHPLFSLELLEQEQKEHKSTTAIARSIDNNNLEYMQCFKNSSKKIYCEAESKKNKNKWDKTGNVLLIKLLGIKKEDILDVNITIIERRQISKIKNLLW